MFQTEQINKLADLMTCFCGTSPNVTQSRLLCTQLITALQVQIQGVEKPKIFFPPDWVSTKVGTEIVCRYNAPKNLNSQHTPQFGQPKHAPETSQMCPLMPLNSSSKQTKATRILRLHNYITKFLSKSQIFASPLHINTRRQNCLFVLFGHFIKRTFF